jgi:hypothetical protein
MAGWNLALRFGLEIGALFGLGAAAWKLTPGWFRWVLAIVVPVAAAIVWGVFNVLGDPSRSGGAPVEVHGWIRLALELAILLAGAAGMWIAFRHEIGIAFAILIVVHYAMSWNRIQWLIG